MIHEVNNQFAKVAANDDTLQFENVDLIVPKNNFTMLLYT